MATRIQSQLGAGSNARGNQAIEADVSRLSGFGRPIAYRIPRWRWLHFNPAAAAMDRRTRMGNTKRV